MSLTKEKRERIKEYLLEKTAEGRENAAMKACEAFGITKTTAYRYLREMERDGMIEKRDGSWRLVVRQETIFLNAAELDNASEDDIYFQHILPLLNGLPENVLNIWYYCFTEMMNNVLDHSDAGEVRIMVSRDYMKTSIVLEDNGIGIFKKIQEYFHYPSPDIAILELFKGKLTTDSENHSGEGIFFVSRILDRFAVIFNGKIFSHTDYQESLQELRAESEEMFSTGTTVLMELSNASRKTAKEIMDQYADPDGGFTKTRIPLKNLFPSYPVSRSQAKRLANRLESFEEVELDFSGLKEIGQGFAHQLFCVFHRQHPEVKLIPYNTSLDVQRMINHVTASEG